MRTPSLGSQRRLSRFRTAARSSRCQTEKETLLDVSAREVSRSIYSAGDGGGLVCSLRNGHDGKYRFTCEWAVPKRLSRGGHGHPQS